MKLRGLFLFAYICSGLAGLVYEVSWTRLLTLYMGHTTAAASTVVAAFMGGLAGGAVVAGRVAPGLSVRQALRGYVALEGAVVLCALALPFEMAALRPLLAWAYNDAAGGVVFPAVRLIASLLLLVVPAAALGATFPLAVRAFTRGRSGDAGRLGGTLYALNTAGAAAGALLAGFVLIPSVGVSGAVWVGAAASLLAMAAASVVARSATDDLAPELEAGPPRSGVQKKKKRRIEQAPSESASAPYWLVPVILALTGFASLMFEIAWTRVLALTLGPTTYAFATALAALITGLACGSGAGAWIAGRTRRPAFWLSLVLVAGAVASSIACGLAGSEVPRRVAEQVAGGPDTFGQMLARAAMLAATLVFPASAAFGAAFPLALSLLGARTDAHEGLARHAGFVYAVNTIAAVAGSLLAGFAAIPLLGLEQTLRLVTALLLVAGMIVVFWGGLSPRGRRFGLGISAAAVLMFALSPAWDRELLASGVYKYSGYVAHGVDVPSALKAGALLYYREGAASTVTVKRLTGTTTLAIDGKVDASNGSDMLTQKLIAHLPLLLHESPKEICIIGVGSGVTLGAALRHPVTGVDVVEISPEVVEASRFFAAENHHALDDPRTRLIVGDGRSHLALGKRKYDVIISEPSNPWIAGVASLFTREFFETARDRLAPGGLISQWAHTYNISADDLRSIVATFTSVFPNGTVWMVGQDDVLLVAGGEPLESRLGGIARNWNRPGVAEDLRAVSATEPFSIWSLYAGGPDELRRYSNGAPIQNDDRTALEFSGPRSMDNRDAGTNAAGLSSLLGENGGPDVIRDARAKATPAQWRARAAMMMRAEVAGHALDDYFRALEAEPGDREALDGVARTAPLAGRVDDSLPRIEMLFFENPHEPAILVAKSKLLAARGDVAEAVDVARQASEIRPLQPVVLEQLGSLFNALADVEQLDVVVAKLKELAPALPATPYYEAVAHLLHGRFAESVKSAEQAIQIDPQYAAAYDLIGAAHLKQGAHGAARSAFETSLRFNPHDSTAYTNLGIIELNRGNREAAGRYFAEALWLDPGSGTARQGLAQSTQ